MASKPLLSASATRSEPPEDPSVGGEEAAQAALCSFFETNREHGTGPTLKDVLLVIDSLKKQLAAERCISVKKTIEENRVKLAGVTNHFYTLSIERRTCNITDTQSSLDLLTRRQKDAIDMHNGIHASKGDRESNGYHEDSHGSTAVLLGSNVAVKNAVRPVKLPEVKRLPPYTTWIFLDRNQRMTEDQSVVGRRRIYYDQNGGEALICSDSEEEIIEEEEEKRDFVESEDYILCMTVKEFGLSDLVLELLAQCFSRNTCEVKRYETRSNILYRQDMKFLVTKTILVGVLRIGMLRRILKVEILFWKKILKQLLILLTTFFVDDVLFLIADYMDVHKILPSLLRNNLCGSLLMQKMHHVGQIVINRY